MGRAGCSWRGERLRSNRLQDLESKYKQNLMLTSRCIGGIFLKFFNSATFKNREGGKKEGRKPERKSDI